MGGTTRLEIEARLFVFTYLGGMRREGQLTQAAANQPQLLADLLGMFPLERWHAQGLISEQQVAGWIAQALPFFKSLDDEPRQ